MNTTTNHPARCRCDECMKESTTFTFRLRTSELTQLHRSAELHGMKVSELIRWRLVADIEVKP